VTSRESTAITGVGGRVRAAILVCIGVTLAGVFAFAVRRQPLHGDAFVLVRGSSNIIHCVREGRFTSCNNSIAHAANGPADVGAFPLLQYIPSVALRAVGVSMEWTLRALALLSFASLVAVLLVAYYTLRRVAPPLWAPLVTAALLASPLLYYGRSAAGEDLAAAVILAAVAAVLLDARPLVVCALVVFACLTKETNPPFVFALAVICAVAPRRGTAAQRRRMLWVITIGVVAGVALNSAFNVFRFGSLQNSAYMQPALENTKPGLILRLFVAQWFSPNGGLLWFWLLAPALVIGVAVLASGRPRWSVERLAAPAVALLLFGQILLLSTWWQPFGWYAWGPRLVLPLIPAFIVAGAAVAAPYATPATAKLLRSRAFVPVVLVAIASGVAQVAVVFSLGAVPQFFAATAKICSRATGPSGAGTARYYRCLLNSAWLRNPTMLRLGLDGLTKPWGAVVSTAFAVAVALLFYTARRAVSAPESGAPPEPSAQPDDRIDAGEPIVVGDAEVEAGDYEPARTRSRSSSFATFPVAFNGSSFTISNVRGTL
jgi:hypothetical protein